MAFDIPFLCSYAPLFLQNTNDLSFMDSSVPSRSPLQRDVSVLILYGTYWVVAIVAHHRKRGMRRQERDKDLNENRVLSQKKK